MRNSSSNLTARQLRWIDEYLVDFNGAAAAVRAGYSRKCARSIAYENTTKLAIQEVLHSRQAEMGNKLRITREGVVRGLVEAVDTARLQQNPMAMISGLRELGRMMGFYAPAVKRVEVTATPGPHTHFERLSDSELVRLVGAGQAAAQ